MKTPVANARSMRIDARTYPKRGRRTPVVVEAPVLQEDNGRLDVPEWDEYTHGRDEPLDVLVASGPPSTIVIDERLPESDCEIVVRVPRRLADADGWATCAFCDAKFKPDVLTRAHCSTECAVRAFYKRQGLKPPTIITKSDDGEEREVIVLRRTRVSLKPRSVRDPQADATKDAKYGPMRTVGKTLADLPNARRQVQLVECGHVASVKPTYRHVRCRTCLGKPVRGAKRAPASKSNRVEERKGRARKTPVTAKKGGKR